VSEIRVALPSHLRTLAGTGPEVRVRVEAGVPTLADVLDALERAHPPLRGTIRARGDGARRPYIRYLACGEDLSHEPAGSPLPEAVARGAEPLRVVGAIAGG
jgi:molybdopterin synthase sulfur carrier subunit